MNENLEGLLRMYRANLRHYLRDKERCPGWVIQEIILLYEMMERHIPDYHIDQINLLVYGITRKK